MSCSKLTVSGLILLGAVPGLLVGGVFGGSAGYRYQQNVDQMLDDWKQLAEDGQRNQQQQAEAQTADEARTLMAERAELERRAGSLGRVEDLPNPLFPWESVALAGFFVVMGGALVYGGRRQTGATDQDA